MPTLAGGDLLNECLAALDRQTFREFEAVVVDNSGSDRVPKTNLPDFVRVLASPRNLGYGGAINFACRESRSEFVAALNDDAIAHPGWLERADGGRRFPATRGYVGLVRPPERWASWIRPAC